MPLTISLLTILVAAVADMLIGFLWYSRWMFGKRWQKLIGKNDKELKKMKQNAGSAFVGNALASLVTAFILAHCIVFLQADFVGAGAIIAFWLWLGFVATSLLVPHLYEDRPIGLYLIYVSYRLVAMMVMGGILAVW